MKPNGLPAKRKLSPIRNLPPKRRKLVHSLQELTNYQTVSVQDVAKKVRSELELKQRKADDEERCPICFCDLLDCDLLDADQIAAFTDPDDVVRMSQCTDHYFHRECLENQLKGQTYLKCAVCSHTYGERTGDMPSGTMTVERQPFSCEGYEKVPTWTIVYAFPGGTTTTGKRYQGD